MNVAMPSAVSSFTPGDGHHADRACCVRLWEVTQVMQAMTDMRITLTPRTKQGSGKENVLAGEYVA